MIGRNAAVAEIGTHCITLTGFVAFIAWFGVHAWLLTNLPARMAACIKWAWNYFGGVNVEGILDSPGPSPIATSSAKTLRDIDLDPAVADLK